MKTRTDVNSKHFLDGITQTRNTPRSDGISPAQVVFGRSIRTMLPALTELWEQITLLKESGKVNMTLTPNKKFDLTNEKRTSHSTTRMFQPLQMMQKQMAKQSEAMQTQNQTMQKQMALKSQALRTQNQAM